MPSRREVLELVIRFAVEGIWPSPEKDTFFFTEPSPRRELAQFGGPPSSSARSGSKMNFICICRCRILEAVLVSLDFRHVAQFFDILLRCTWYLVTLSSTPNRQAEGSAGRLLRDDEHLAAADADDEHLRLRRGATESAAALRRGGACRRLVPTIIFALLVRCEDQASDCRSWSNAYRSQGVRALAIKTTSA